MASGVRPNCSIGKPGWIVFDDHARAFIDLPDIVVAVDADRMGEGFGVVVRPHLAA